MNKPSLYMAAGLLGLSLPVSADLFFSEYIEGSSFNKALEIYNNSGTAVDLSNYQVKIYFNGNPTAGATINLAGSVASGDVYVIADDGADSVILSQADLTPSNNFFNGDDAIELLNAGIVIDSIGQVGTDPGSQWGVGNISTQNNTIRRLTTVSSGDTNSSDLFDPAVEWQGFAQDTFSGLGSYNDEQPPESAEFALIHQVQGRSDTSPMLGMNATIEAIVVGDFQNNAQTDNGELGGFYLQEEDMDTDADPLTSEGIFVYDAAGSVDVKVGDKVTVTGEVKEYYNLTQISASTVEVLTSGETLPTVTQLMLPVATVDELEAYEGMRVNFSQALVISEYYNFDRYGEIVLSQPLDGEQRPMTPTAMEIPGSPEYQNRHDLNLLSRITFDDGRSSQNPDPAFHPNGGEFNLTNYFRGGDLVQNATGIMDYRFGLYRLQPTAAANHIITNPRPELPPYIDAGIKVASFNVLNYFSTLDENGNTCGSEMSLNCRGADNIDEFNRQRNKIINAIATIDADIVGLIEIENNETASIDDLVNGLNGYLGAGRYSKVDTGYIGSDAIKVAFIYQHEKIKTAGDFAILDSSTDARFIDDKNRPALAQTFISKSNAGRFTVVVNHLKSKGSGCDDLGDPDTNDGQGNCNLTRSAAAEALVDWLAGDPTGQGDDDILIIGDLNAYDKEDPIRVITDAGYSDLILRDEGEQAYTYVFDGQYGYLDYALSNASLEPQSVEARVWHINADEADIFDYNIDFKKDAQDALYETSAFRSSDHDPVIVGLNLTASIDDIRFYIDASVREGKLVGAGRKPSINLSHFLKHLTLANRAEVFGPDNAAGNAACNLLRKSELSSDGMRHPRDLVEGKDAPVINQMIVEYRMQNCR